MKPVAWIREDGVVAFHEKKEVDSQGFKWFALYTHPVKELTNEEIYDFTNRMIICSGQNPNAADINIFGLTRIVEDILRKAQEK